MLALQLFKQGMLQTIPHLQDGTSFVEVKKRQGEPELVLIDLK